MSKYIPLTITQKQRFTFEELEYLEFLLGKMSQTNESIVKIVIFLYQSKGQFGSTVRLYGAPFVFPGLCCCTRGQKQTSVR